EGPVAGPCQAHFTCPLLASKATTPRSAKSTFCPAEPISVADARSSVCQICFAVLVSKAKTASLSSGATITRFPAMHGVLDQRNGPARTDEGGVARRPALGRGGDGAAEPSYGRIHRTRPSNRPSAITTPPLGAMSSKSPATPGGERFCHGSGASVTRSRGRL